MEKNDFLPSSMRDNTSDDSEESQEIVPSQTGELDRNRIANGQTGMGRLRELQLRGIKRVNNEEVKSDLDLQREEDALPLSVKERRQTVQVYEVFKEKA